MAENEKLNNVAVDNDVGTMEDVDAIMKKYDRESNTRVWEGTPRKILRVLTALFGIFLIVMNMWIKMDERARRPLFLGLVIILVFIYYPIKKGSQKVNYMPWYDIVMAAVGAFCFFFYPLNLEKIVTAGTRIQKVFVVQIGSVSIPLLIVFAIVGTLILVECCRRVVGMPIICVATVFVLYAFLGAGKDLKTVMYNLFYTTTGILPDRRLLDLHRAVRHLRRLPGGHGCCKLLHRLRERAGRLGFRRSCKGRGRFLCPLRHGLRFLRR